MRQNPWTAWLLSAAVGCSSAGTPATPGADAAVNDAASDGAAAVRWARSRSASAQSESPGATTTEVGSGAGSGTTGAAGVGAEPQSRAGTDASTCVPQSRPGVDAAAGPAPRTAVVTVSPRATSTARRKVAGAIRRDRPSAARPVRPGR